MNDAGPSAPADKKPLVEQILAWSESSLTDWQRDALRRLFVRSSPELTQNDYEELFALMKQANGIAASSAKTAKPWAREHLPNVAANADHVTLNGMSGLKHVNRLTADQSLQFAPIGLTVIYGGNGSGKSGYTRVLKRACRARDQTEPVHPDATDETQRGKAPQATFEVEISGKKKSVTWTLGGISPDELSTLAVFDSKCARAYVTTEGDVQYVPYGLDVVGSLATNVLPRLEKLLTAEIAALNVDTQAIDGLRGATKVGSLVETFGPKTDEKEIRALAVMTTEEVAKLAELDKTLAQDDPIAQAKKVRLESQRLKDLILRIGRASLVVNEGATNTYKKLDADAIASAKAMEAAAEALRSGEELLRGTGDEVWRHMFEAARRFSVEVAYPDHEFPHVDDGAVCPLCQQEVDGVADRLKRFQTFLEQDTAKTAKQFAAAASGAMTKLNATEVGLGIDEALAKEIEAIDKSLLNDLRLYEAALVARRTAIVLGLKDHDWSAVVSLPSDPSQALQTHAEKLDKDASALEAAGNAETRNKLLADHRELAARRSLHKEVERVTTLLGNLKLKQMLEGCRKDLRTNAISAKAKSFAEEAITIALRDALDREFKALGGVPIDTKLADRNDKGKTKYKLQITASPGAKLEEILSEGEQRAIAIGSFLAELGLAGHNGGIIFDDPVSSLDHKRKTKIGERLVEEAKHRQVIVFSHDLPFVSLLLEDATKGNVPYMANWLEADAKGAGRVTLNDCPYEGRGYRDTKLAKASLAQAKTATGNARVNFLREAADRARRTLEEVVQHHVFKNVVVRWREDLRLTRMNAINWDRQVGDEIYNLFGELSRFVSAHSHSEEYTGATPDFDDVSKLIDRLDAVIAKAKPDRT